MLVTRGRDDEFVKVLDFGIAKVRGVALTHSGMVFGTPEYMSPEQLEDSGSIDHRSDVYSAGVVLFEMLAGRLPFQGDSFQAVQAQQLTSPVPDPRAFNPKVGKRVAEMVRRALQKSPVDRYQGCLQFQKAIEHYQRRGAWKYWLVSACVLIAAGVYVGWHTPELTTVQTRLQGDAFWEILTFLLNGLLFVTVGLSLPAVLDGLGGHITTTLVWQALAVVAAVIVIRFLWVFPATYVPRALSKRIRAADPYPPWQYPALISWTGMRGAVSLAAALAIPLHTDAGVDFPGRDLIIYLTFAVILATLVGQGLTMPMVIRALGLEDDGVAEREAVKARIHAADAALNRIDELRDEEWVREDTADRLRRLYRFRRNRFAERYTGDGDGAIEERSAAYQQLLRELINAERQAVVELRGAGAIGDDAMREVHRELDLEEARLDL